MAIENFKKIPISSAYAADWSVKNSDGKSLNKLRNSVFKHKQNNVFLARQVGDKFEIFKGKKAFRILTEKDIPEIIIYNYGEITETVAKLIYLENSIVSGFNYIEVGEVIKQLNLEFENHEIERYVNYSLSELEDLVNLANFDWSKYLKKQPKEVQGSFF